MNTMISMNIIWRAGVFIAAAVVAGALTGIASGGASASSCVSWTGVQPPNPSLSVNSLSSVAVLSSCNAWAVGAYSNGTAGQTLIEHWNGSSWTQVASPNPGGSSQDNDLSGVAATSSTNIWAVGTYINNNLDGGPLRTLVLHWNGTAWTQEASPNPGASFNELRGVAATSASNAWAVGFYFTANGKQKTLIEHWNGTAWRHVSSPNPSPDSGFQVLLSVTALSRGNAWAVGGYDNGPAELTLIEHWNGSSWTQVASPNRGARINDLNGVAATSSGNIWAVGDYRNGIGSPFQTLILHWNGTRWRRVASPNPGGSSNDNGLAAVAATSATNIWAVGDYNNGTAKQTLALHCC